MSFKIDIKSGHKKQVAVIMKEIANLLSMSTNDTFTLQMELQFQTKEEVGK